jgi:deferrochelatase/peroxidase EfeB
MAAGSLVSPRPAPSWQLSDPIAKQTQGLVVTGFGALPTGRALFLEFNWPGEKGPAGWLDRLMAIAPITSAVPPDKSDPNTQTQAASVAFTATGLRRMGLPEECLASFARAFWEGMFQEDRLRRLGDRRNGEWLSTVIDGGPEWSANVPLRPPVPSLAGAFDVPSDGPVEQHIETPRTVHALLLLYTKDEAAAEDWAGQVQSKLTFDSVNVVRPLKLLLDVEQVDAAQGAFSREHFGFADGLSQPLPYDANANDTDKAVRVGDQAATQDPVQGVPLGEFLIGYINGHHEKAPGPVVADHLDREGKLPAASQVEGFRDLGLNGSYLVVRELEQDVAAFWRSMEKNAADLSARDPSAQHITGEWLAERVIGRDRDGHLLCPGNLKWPACSDGSPDSSFLFYDRDAAATGCPPGSHVRRAFPRDALTPQPEGKQAKPPTEETKQTLLQAANNHRILRRGRKFGTKLQDPLKDDGADRGLLFMCLNTDIDRQFEFVQQTWLLNSSFATLFQEVDPLVGPAGSMTIRDAPLRRIAHVDTFVRMAGGDYFFLPSLPALRFLALL